MDYSNLEIISPAAAQRIKDLAKPATKSKKHIFIDDIEPLLQALKSGVVFEEVFFSEHSPDLTETTLDLLQKYGTVAKIVPVETLNKIFKGDKKPKTFGVGETPTPLKMDEIAKLSGDIVLLDGVKITGNIGAIIRSAYALGASSVLLLDSELTDVYDRRIIRASRGYVFSLPVLLVNQDQLPQLNYRKITFDMVGELNLTDISTITEKLILIFGGEKRGISAGNSTKDTVKIPMRAEAESLNVSVTTGIGLSYRLNHNLKS